MRRSQVFSRSHHIGHTTGSVSAWRIGAFFLPLVVVLALAVINIAYSGKLVNHGEKIAALQQDMRVLKKETLELETALAKATSLHEIKKQALAEGYVPVSTMAYLEKTTPVALR